MFSWNSLAFSIIQMTCLVAQMVNQMVKHLPTMWETQFQSLGLEDPLEKEMATHSSILAWKIPWTVEPGRLQSMGSQRVGHTAFQTLVDYNDYSISSKGFLPTVVDIMVI